MRNTFYRVVLCSSVLYCLCVIVSGCASGNKDINISRLLKDIEASTQKKPVYAGPDSPDSPVSRGAPPQQEGRSSQKTAPSAPLNKKDITIQPDCIVQVTVAEDATLDGSYPVNEIGAIEFGYVGPVILYNKTEEEAAVKITEIVESRYINNAAVKVKIIRASYDRVKVGGAVNKPGIIKIGAGDGISLNDALLQAGGLRPSARGAKVKIVRGGLRSAVSAAMKGEEYTLVTEDGKPTVPEVILKNNDMIDVFSTEVAATDVGGEKEVTVLGEVNQPGIYRFSGVEPCTVMHLIFKMGGLPLYANKKELKVVRKNQDGTETEFEVNAEKILKDGDPNSDFQLENGDRIIVPERKISLF